MIQSVRSSRKLSWLALSCLLAGIALSACQLTPSYSQSTNQTNPDRATVIGNAQPGPGAATDQMTTPAGLEIIPELSPAVNRSAGWPDLPEITQMPTPTLAPDPTATPAPTLAPTATPAPTLAPTATPIPTRAPTSTPRPTAAPTPKPTSPPTPTPDPNTIQIHLAGVPGNWPPSGSQQSRVDQFIILVNEARAAEGLPALKTGSASLRELAAIRAAEVSINFSHDRPTTLTSSIKWYSLLKAFNIGFLWAGENICGGPSTPAAALTVFMNSTGHRANILSSEADTIAIGVYTDAAGKDWWAQNFIKAR